MKKVILTMLILVSGVSASAAKIKPGDQVLETFEARSVQKVIAVLDDGLIQLEDGMFYHRSYIEALLNKFEDLEVGQKVMLDLDGQETKLSSVVAIATDGTVLASNKIWYYKKYVRPLVTSFGGFEAGTRVVESYEERSIQKILAISDNGYFKLSDGIIYDMRWLTKVTCSDDNAECKD